MFVQGLKSYIEVLHILLPLFFITYTYELRTIHFWMSWYLGRNWFAHEDFQILKRRRSSNGFVFKMWICFSFSIAVIIWHHNLHVACKLFFLANESFLPNIAEWKMEALFLFSFSLTHTNTLTFFYTPFCFLSNDLAKTCVKPFRKRFEAISSMIKYKTLESIL